MRACRWTKHDSNTWLLEKKRQRCVITADGSGKNRTYRLACMGFSSSYYGSLTTAKTRGCTRLRKGITHRDFLGR